MMNFEEILRLRREAVIESIKPLDAAEVAVLGESIFPSFDEPWKALFLGFLTEYPAASYYHANLPDNAQLLYSHSHNRGIWFIPGSGKGVISEGSLKILSDIVSGKA